MALMPKRVKYRKHMRGVILVLTTPYFVITDAAGNFRLSDIPAGHYTLKAWINSKTTVEQPVEVKDSTVRMDFP